MYLSKIYNHLFYIKVFNLSIPTTKSNTSYEKLLNKISEEGKG